MVNISVVGEFGDLNLNFILGLFIMMVGDISFTFINFGWLSMNEIDKITIYSSKYKLIFNPRQDITAYELSRITQLFFVVSTNKSYGAYNIDEFLEKHKLHPHFDMVDL